MFVLTTRNSKNEREKDAKVRKGKIIIIQRHDQKELLVTRGYGVGRKPKWPTG